MAICVKCGIKFTPTKYKSTIGCKRCVKRCSDKINRGVRLGAKLICHRCGKKFIIQKDKSTIVCPKCAKDMTNGESWEIPIPIYSRFDILDI